MSTTPFALRTRHDMKNIILFVLLGGLVAGVAEGQSYELLEGRRLEQFTRTRGGSEAGALITLHLPAKTLASAELTKGPVQGRRSFVWKKVRIEVDETNTHWKQTLRKLEKDAKGTLVLKGKVRFRKDAKGEADYFLLIDSIQKTSRRR